MRNTLHLVSALLATLIFTLLFATDIEAAQVNSFRISFKFERSKDDELDRINEVLAKLPLSSLEIAETEKGYDDYLLRTKRYDKNDVLIETTYRHGFDSIELLCTMNSEEKMHYYKIDAEAFPYDASIDFEEFSARWDKEHPDRVRRLTTEIDFPESKAKAFIILHHKKDAD